MAMTLTINGKSHSIENGTPLAQAMAAIAPDCGALAARIGGEVVDLNYTPKRDCEVEFLTIESTVGRKVYERSMIFLFLMALADLYPNAHAVVEYSLGEALYMTLSGMPMTLSAADVRRLEQHMRALVAQNIPFTRERWSIEKALEHYKAAGQTDKLRLLASRRFSYFDVYRAGKVTDYLYGRMVPSTGYLNVFALRFRLPGVLMLLPNSKNPSRPAPVMENRKYAMMMDESERWGRIMHCHVVADLNDMIEHKTLRDYIRASEARHEKHIASIAEQIDQQGARVVLIAGPSSSGKTTLSKRLAVHLRMLGLRPVTLSLDDYYRDRDTIPMDENGQRDLEHIETLDIPQLNEDLERLLMGEEVELPLFSFITNKREPAGKRMQIAQDQPLIIEGIHALNPRLTESIPPDMKFKVYISALTTLNLDDHNRIRTTDARLLRRLVRDHETRGASMEETLGMWGSVRKGEETWIFPFQEQADAYFNSSMGYELAVLKKHAYPLLEAVPRESPHYARASSLVKFLNYFKDADVEDEIPPTSILREFIGGCTFYIKD